MGSQAGQRGRATVDSQHSGRATWDHQPVSRVELSRLRKLGSAVALAVAVLLALAPYRTSVRFVNGDQIIHVPSKCGPPIAYAFKNEPRVFLGDSDLPSVRGINCRSGGRKRVVAAAIALAVAAVVWFTGRGRRRAPTEP
jgi:hypothetical protein